MYDVSVEQGTTSKPPAIRWKGREASEAKLLVRQMHKRIPAWKLKLCVEALNARPIDHVRITEATEIQFENDELVDVALGTRSIQLSFIKTSVIQVIRSDDDACSVSVTVSTYH